MEIPEPDVTVIALDVEKAALLDKTRPGLRLQISLDKALEGGELLHMAKEHQETGQKPQHAANPTEISSGAFSRQLYSTSYDLVLLNSAQLSWLNSTIC